MKNSICLIPVLCFCLAGKAQSAQLKIMDFSIMPVFQDPDTRGSNDSTELIASFKINTCDSVLKAHIYFGTQKDLADVKSVEATFIRENGKCFVVFNGKQKEIQGYNAGVEIILNKQQFSSFTNAALSIEKTNGKNTTRVYTKK